MSISTSLSLHAHEVQRGGVSFCSSSFLSLQPFFVASLPLPSRGAQFQREAAVSLADLTMTTCDWSLANAIRQAARCTRGKRVRHTPLSLQMHFYCTSLWKRDIVEGGVNAVRDAVLSHLELSGNLVVAQHVYKHVDSGDPRVEVRLSCMLGSDIC